MPEKKQLRMRFKSLSVDADQGIFEGYASVAGVVDGDGDVVEPGAFQRTLTEGFAKNGVKILALHNEYLLPIGKSLELREDAQGLYIKGYIAPTSMGNDVRQLVKDGVLGDLSIGYNDQIAVVDEKGIRHLKDIELYEISIVTWPANAAARINGYKGGLPGMAKEDAKQYDPALVEQLVAAVKPLADLAQQLTTAAPSSPATPETPDGDDDMIEIGDED